MINIIFGVYIFLSLLSWIVFIDIILSWLLIFQIRFRPQFISNILDPIYGFVKKHIPTTIGPIDFSAMIILFIIYFMMAFIQDTFPQMVKLLELYK